MVLLFGNSLTKWDNNNEHLTLFVVELIGVPTPNMKRVCFAEFTWKPILTSYKDGTMNKYFITLNRRGKVQVTRMTILCNCHSACILYEFTGTKMKSRCQMFFKNAVFLTFDPKSKNYFKEHIAPLVIFHIFCHCTKDLWSSKGKEEKSKTTGC